MLKCHSLGRQAGVNITAASSRQNLLSSTHAFEMPIPRQAELDLGESYICAQSLPIFPPRFPECLFLRVECRAGGMEKKHHLKLSIRTALDVSHIARHIAR